MFHVEPKPLKHTKNTGDLGETIAARHLISKGYTILVRNYRKKYGEIDIIAQEIRMSGRLDPVSHETSKEGEFPVFSRETSNIIHFVEVKSVSYETKALLDWAVSHETWRPEEQVHAFKLRQIRKTAETWMSENGWSGEVQIDVMTVRMVPDKKYALVSYIKS